MNYIEEDCTDILLNDILERQNKKTDIVLRVVCGKQRCGMSYFSLQMSKYLDKYFNENKRNR